MIVSKRKKVQRIVFIFALIVIGVFLSVNYSKYLFRADFFDPTPKILLPVDNERFIYTDNPLIQGKALPDAPITIYTDDVETGQTTADSSGNFYYKPQSPITQGIHSLAAKDTNNQNKSNLTYIEINTTDPSKAILKAQDTQIIENNHPFYANGANDFSAIINLSESKAGVEKRFDDMEKAGIKMVRVINYMLRDMKLPDPVSAPTALVENGGGLPPASYVYRYTCANLSKNSNNNNYETGETLPSPITSSVDVSQGQKVTLTMPACAQSYRYFIYRRNANEVANSETLLGFAEKPAGQPATFVDDGSYALANGVWGDTALAPVLSVEQDTTSTLPAGDYVYRFALRQQRKPVNGIWEKFPADGTTLVGPTAQITVAAGQKVKVNMPTGNSGTFVDVFRRLASDPENSEKCVKNSLRVQPNETIWYDNSSNNGSVAIPSANTTKQIGMPSVNETMDNPSTYGGKPFMTGFGNWNEDKLIDTDYALDMARRHNIRILFTFIDQHDNLTGGVREIARNCATWNSNFFADPCSRDMFKEIIDKFTTRTSTITGRLYKDDPAIFAWEFINEPWETNGGNGFRNWIWEMGTYLKSKDPNHMLSSGDDGSIWFTHPSEGGFNGGNNHDFVMMGTPEPIDLLTWHGYPEANGFMFNHGYYGEFNPTRDLSPAAAAEWLDKYGPVSGPISVDQATKQLQLHAHYAYLLNKPVVFGEWGVDWTKSSGADWINGISNAILNSKPDLEKIQNIIPESSFSEPLTNFWNTGTYTAALSLSNEEIFNNNPSIKLEAKTINDSAGKPQYYNGVSSIKIPVKPNTSYWYEFTGKNLTSKTLEIKADMYANGVLKGSIGGGIGQTTYNNGWRTINRLAGGACEYTTPSDVNEISINASLINGQAGDIAYIGDIKFYELGVKTNSNTTTFAATGWWALPDSVGLGNLANTEALKNAAVNFAQKSMSGLSPLSIPVTPTPTPTPLPSNTTTTSPVVPPSASPSSSSPVSTPTPTKVTSPSPVSSAATVTNSSGSSNTVIKSVKGTFTKVKKAIQSAVKKTKTFLKKTKEQIIQKELQKVIDKINSTFKKK